MSSKKIVRKKYFFKLLLTFTAVALLLVIFSMGIFSRLYIKDIKEKNISYYYNKIQQMDNDFTSIMDQMNGMYAYLIQNPDVYFYLNGHEYDPYTANKVFIYTKLIKNSNPNILSIILLNKEINDYILAGSNSVDINQFMLEDFTKKYYESGMNLLLSNISSEYNSAEHQPYTLAIIYKDKSSEKTASYIIINLDNNYIDDNFMNYYDGTTLVVDGEGKIIFNNDSQFDFTVSNETFWGSIVNSDVDSSSFETTINGERSILSFQKNSQTGFYLISINPFNIIVQEINSSLYRIICFSAALLAASLVIIYLMARKLYSPISKITETFKTYKSKTQHTDESEISIIDNVYHEIVDDIKDLKEQNDSKALESAIRKLLIKCPVSEEEQSRLSSVFVEAREYTLFAISIDRAKFLFIDEAQKKHMIIKRIIENELSLYSETIAVILNQGEFAVLINNDLTSANSFSLLLENLSKLKSSITKSVGGTVTVGIGTSVRSAEDIIASYNKSVDMCRQRFVMGYNRTIYQVLVSKKLKLNPLLPIELVSNMVSDIKSFNKNDFLLNADELIAYIKNYNYKDVCNIIIETLTVLIRNINLKINDNERQVNFSDHYQAFMQIETIDKLSQWFSDLFDEYMTQINKADESLSIKHDKVIHDIIEFINRNYSDSELSLEKISDIEKYSPYYISKMFKKATGISFTDYLKKVRIDAAKVLLKTSDTSVVSIAEKVGIDSPSYFGSIFKKEIGLSPKAYRDSIDK